MVQHLIKTHMCSRAAENRKDSRSLAYISETDMVRINKIIVIGMSRISITQHIASHL